MRLALAVVVLLALAGCGRLGPSPTAEPVAGVDTTSRELLARHGQTAVGPTSIQTVTIGDAADLPWLLYLEASQAIGLDFSGLEGVGAELRVTPVTGGDGTSRAFVLVRNGAAIGAWRDLGGTSSGVVSLDARP